MPEGHKETLQLIFIPQVLAWYIQYQHIYSNDTYSKHLHFPTLCPKGTQKPINLNSSPKCWHVISNTKLFIQLTYISQIVGTIYEYSYITLTYIYFQKNCSIIQYIYILSSSFSYQVHFKNITYVELLVNPVVSVGWWLRLKPVSVRTLYLITTTFSIRFFRPYPLAILANLYCITTIDKTYLRKHIKNWRGLSGA